MNEQTVETAMKREQGECWTIESILHEMAKAGASDLILTAGSYPQLRILGSLQPVGDTILTPADTERIASSFLTPNQLQTLREKRSVDLSKSFPGLPRFRFNLFHQRDSIGLVARLIASQIPSIDDLGLPPIIANSRCGRTG